VLYTMFVDPNKSCTDEDRFTTSRCTAVCRSICVTVCHRAARAARADTVLLPSNDIEIRLARVRNAALQLCRTAARLDCSTTGLQYGRTAGQFRIGQNDCDDRLLANIESSPVWALFA